MEVEMKKCWLYARTDNKDDIILGFSRIGRVMIGVL